MPLVLLATAACRMEQITMCFSFQGVDPIKGLYKDTLVRTHPQDFIFQTLFDVVFTELHRMVRVYVRQNIKYYTLSRLDGTELVLSVDKRL